jgi:hypothetical protein
MRLAVQSICILTQTLHAQFFCLRILICLSGVSTNLFCIFDPLASFLSKSLRWLYPRLCISSTSILCLLYNATSLPFQRNVSGWCEYPVFPCVRMVQIACSSRCSPNKCCRQSFFGGMSQIRILNFLQKNQFLRI